MLQKVTILIFLALATIGGKMLEQTPEKSATMPASGHQEPAKPSEIPDGLFPVIRIVDGDTIVVEVARVQEKVRLIGVDTPETVDPRRPVQCFGKEASAFAKNLLSSKRVRLEADATQGDRDKYGRLLRYVFLADGTLVNKEIIEQGYGHEYTYRIPYRYQTDFKKAERSAREQQKGLWKPAICNK